MLPQLPPLPWQGGATATDKRIRQSAASPMARLTRRISASQSAVWHFDVVVVVWGMRGVSTKDSSAGILSALSH